MTCNCCSSNDTNDTKIFDSKNLFLPKETKIVKVIQSTQLERHFTLRLADGGKMKFYPGQILEVSLHGYGEIPIGLASSPTRENTFDIVIRSTGRVSTAINQLKEGDSLFIRGPLGHGFDLPVLRNNNILIVAGGIGLCPTRSLIQYIMDRRSEFKRFSLFYGSRDPSQQMFLDDLSNWRGSADVEFHETVDKGDATWKGNVGVITTLFKKANIAPDTKVIICGPPVMFKFVIKELDSVGISHKNIFVDLERRMKCGLGKCGHCQINDKYVCVDGPVFTYSDIENLEEAL
ncbi:MAG: FAD/NAD(P)-binding protein [Oligoflexia bacterium]|nr:FAD/NAD(P)-binding protein [Oligoflexia bacterium]